ncbi:MAG: hypothetical protein IJA87_11350 [Clostridia bacterium]|nr:hypothetical protein [Clostridia bacterium]
MDENNVFEPEFVDVPAEEAPAAEPAQPTYEQEPVYVTPPAFEQPAVSPKKRTVALILAIVVGELGINQLYLGLGSKRLIMAIIATVCDALSWIPVLGWITAIASIPLWIICLVGAIKDIIATAKGTMLDGQGLPVKNW